MSVAFDTVEHNIQRLSQSFGIKNMALSWLESYINGRTQSVHLSREEKPPRPVTCGVTGVPKGSVLAMPSKLCDFARAHTSRDKRTCTRNHGAHTQTQ